jgi:acyl-CoA thioester hydrolase
MRTPSRIHTNLSYKTHYRVIYGDTDNMGVVYYANYLRWFEIGRTELFRSLGITYKTIEAQGLFLPVTEVHSKFSAPATYDDEIIIETVLDTGFRAGMKFDYQIFKIDEKKPLASGYTKHAYLNSKGMVVRPPKFLKEIINNHLDSE